MMFHRSLRLAALGALAFPVAAAAQRGGGGPRAEPANPIQEGLPLKPERTIRFTTDVGSWMSLDVSPDGQTIVFDHLGDIFTVPITGGKATAITKGMAVDAQPRFSPDGKRIAFVSDRRGAPNLWHISLDLKDTVQVTTGRTDAYDSPEWTPDGKYIVVSRGNNLHMYHMDGGAGVQLGAPPAAAATTGRGGGAPTATRVIGAAFGKDPRYLWAARRSATGQWTYNDPMGGGYSLVVYDRNTGEFSQRGTRWGAAFRPTLSPDGKWLVYGTRYDQQTGLRIRDLETDQERWLAYPVQRDDQESRASRDVYPGMSFTPDSKNLITTWSGKIWSVPVAGGAPRQIPFSVDVEQHLGPEVKFDYPLSDSATFTVRQIRNATPSPDGKRLAFTALDKLYIMDLPNGAPKRLSDAPGLEFQPTWSPDGQWIAYTSWTEADMGHLWKSRVSGGRPVRLTQSPGAYQQPVFTPDGQRIVAIRGSAPAFAEETSRGGTDLVWVSANGGPVTLIAPTAGASNPHFVKGSNDRIYASSGGRGLFSMRWDGTDIKEHVRISVPSPGGGGGGGGGGGSNASWIRMAPEGDQALAVVGSDLYVATVPLVGGTTPTVNCGNTPNFPCRRLTEIGGAFPAWSWDAKKVHYSMGNAHAIYDLERAKVVDDSVRLANRNRPQRDTTARDSAGPPRQPARPADPEDSTRADAPAPQTRAANAYKPVEFRIVVKANRDIPQSSAVLRGARVVTMRGDEVIENADIVIRNNRIAAIGARGTVQVPQGAEVIDVTGKTITPGFVDTHSHLRVPQPIHRGEVWSFAANLAYGVTTTRDPQTGSTDIFTYEDMIESGEILGPRGLSTGPGVFSGENFRNLEHARQVLKRYSDYYGTGTIKQYVAGNREQRQWVIQAAREQRLMPTTEGSLDLEMNITEAIDGYSGHEHSWPSFPFQSDLITFFAKSGIVYTPTVLVAYGGPWSENYWYQHTNVHGDPKVRRFLPHAEIDNKTLRRGSGGQAGWFHEDEYIMKYVSEQVGDLVAAGGKAGVGSHGQFQGLGYHWELWSMAWDKSKVPPHMGLKMATIMGADAIGRGKDVGSIEVGKMADLVVLDRNPLEDIRNTNSIRYVMKNGRLYDGNTLDEVYPRKRPAKFYWQAGDNPADTPAGGGSGGGPGRPGTSKP